MTLLLRLGAIALFVGALNIASSATALAKECKSETSTISSDPFVSRTLGAFPHSLFVWRRTIREKFGNGWHPWRKAENRKIDCKQARIEGIGKRWVCTRTARPCKGSGREEGKKGPGRGDPDTVINRTLRPGHEGKDVRILQILLQDNGYDITVDGRYGNSTEAIVRKFQKDTGLSVDGVAGPKTVSALGGSTSAGNGSSGSGADDIASTKTVRRGDKGEEVSIMQRFLADGGYRIKVDGNFGRQTERAVRRFQQKEGLTTDGVVGRQTWSRMNS